MKTLKQIISETKDPMTCKSCKMDMYDVAKQMPTGAYDKKDFDRFSKTGLCPMCKGK